MKVPASLANRYARQVARHRGEVLECAAVAELTARGYLCQRLATPTRVVRGQARRTSKVLADIVGCEASGRALLVECKYRAHGRRPTRSDFAPHQRQTLRAWAKRGALVLVAWSEGGRALRLTPALEILGSDHLEEDAAMR